MPYIPDLIPEESKIIAEYFTKQAQTIKAKSAANTGQTLLGLLFLAIAICFIRYFGFAVIFGFIDRTNSNLSDISTYWYRYRCKSCRKNVYSPNHLQ